MVILPTRAFDQSARKKGEVTKQGRAPGVTSRARIRGKKKEIKPKGTQGTKDHPRGAKTPT